MANRFGKRQGVGGSPFWATLCAILAAIGVATSAHAQVGLGDTTGVETPYTPIAKESDGLLQLVSGVRYRGSRPKSEDLQPGSVTSVETELLAVAQGTEGRALAGGVHRSGEAAVPVLYSHTDEQGWEKVPGMGQERGFVAEVAWIDDRRALAVGGDGSYPDREGADGRSTCDEGGRPDEDPAGAARAWLYENGGWRELGADELPAGMRALTAVDFHRDDASVEFGVSGGLCQLWHWSDGGFLKDGEGNFESPYSPESSGSKHLPELIFRVRDTSFTRIAPTTPPLPESEARIQVYAGTAGCCGTGPGESEIGNPAIFSWEPAGDQADPARSGAWTATDVTGLPQEPRAVIPDSLLSLTTTRTWNSGGTAGESKGPGWVRTSVGPLPANAALEPSSSVGPRPGSSRTAFVYDVGLSWGSGLRLVDGAGDVGGSTPAGAVEPLEPRVTVLETAGGTFEGVRHAVGGIDRTGPDGLPDWSVGEITRSRQGAVYGTDPGQLPPPDSTVATPPPIIVFCPQLGGLNVANVLERIPLAAECYLDFHSRLATGFAEQHDNPDRDLARARRSLESHRLLKAPSYRLNAVAIDDTTGRGWAVGAAGAIVRLTSDSGNAVGADEPPSPVLGEPAPTKDPERSLWGDAARERTGKAAAVPPLGDPTKLLTRRSMQFAGWPARAPVSEIVMSGDGSEGWAFVPSGRAPIGGAYYFDGVRWSWCPPSPSPAQRTALPPACKASEGLAKFGAQPTKAVRVPTEYDEDPSNDDEFRVAAVVGDKIALYSSKTHHWNVDESPGGPIRPVSIAFTGRDDGWALKPNGSDDLFYRFDGEKWSQCSVQAGQACDPNRRLPPYGGSGRVQRFVQAGRRIYAIGFRRPHSTSTGVGPADSQQNNAGNVTDGANLRTPFIVYREKGREWSDDFQDGEWDPGWTNRATNVRGTIRAESVSIVQRADGHYEGWGAGAFGGGPEGFMHLVRMAPGKEWEVFQDEGYARYRALGRTVVLDGAEGSPAALAAGTTNSHVAEFDPRRQRWQPVESSRPMASFGKPGGPVEAIAPDGAGGAWLAVGSENGTGQGARFYRYTDRVPEPVFEDVALPSARLETMRLTGMTTDRRGTAWVATNSDTLYRYNPVLGWKAMRVHGWEPGRVVTAPAPANAVAVNSSGRGFAVGKQGRIARVEPAGVALESSSGTPCASTPAPPCSTSRDLLDVDVAEDGSAVAVGQARTIVWWPPGGQPRTVSPPAVPGDTALVAVSHPSADRMWVVGSDGAVYRGERAGSTWAWSPELQGREVSDVLVTADGRGYAAGSDGLLLEREGSGEWSEIATPTQLKLSSLAVPPGDSSLDSVLVGGENGIILTKTKRSFEIARRPDFPSPSAERIAALALAPGLREGEVEAWGALNPHRDRRPAPQLIHHSSSRDDPLMRPGDRGAPLPDVPTLSGWQISVAAFGKSDCQSLGGTSVAAKCPAVLGTTEYADVLSRRVVGEISERARSSSNAWLTALTGDAVDVAGPVGQEARETIAPAASTILDSFTTGVATNSSGPDKLRNWGTLVPDRLAEAGVPVVGAIGGQDLAEVQTCAVYFCAGFSQLSETRVSPKNGDSSHWRAAMAARDAPWGQFKSDRGQVWLRRVGSRGMSVRIPEVGTESPVTTGAGMRSLVKGGADTHYAADLIGDSGKRLARMIVLDSSFGSLSASDAAQRPVELDGGQQSWLRAMLCFKGEPSASSRACSRLPGQPAVVVSNAPPYSYHPEAGAQTATDGATLEAALIEGKANLLISGRLGWNGLYWTLAPGLHRPCLGGEYEPEPPQGVTPCVLPGSSQGADQLQEALAGGGLDPAGAQQRAGVDWLPTIVASGAGGRFLGESHASDPGRKAKDGFWHGYTVAHLDPAGESHKLVVEQRPIYDWVQIEAASHVLRPGQKMILRGFGRGPAATFFRTNVEPLYRIDRIDSPAVTHRYDLLAADPQKPWLPRKGPDGKPVPLDPSIATVDSQTGRVRAGRGNHPRAFAIAMLSVGRHSATFPMAFEPRRTFQPSAQRAPAAPARVIVQSAAPGIAPPGSPSPPPQVGSLTPPALPSVPAIEPPPATPPVGEPQPAPPPPPPPPTNVPTPLDIAAAPVGLTVAPPASVIPPPAPPINPAPPGGARKEARQRQAATEKSGSGSGSEASDAQDAGGDMAQSRMSAEGTVDMTRLDRARAGSGSFTAVSNRDQPSAWARGVVYGGGMVLAALALAGTWTARPRPRPPAVPAPARAWMRRRP